MVALDEHGALPARRDHAAQDRGRVVDRALEGVGLLAAGELVDDRSDALLDRRLGDRPGHVERLGPDVDRGNGEAVDLAATAGHVQLVDARGPDTQRLAGFPGDPAGGGHGALVLGEGRGPGHVADPLLAEARLVEDDQPVAVDPADAVESGEQVRRGSGDVGHLVTPGVGLGARPW